MELKVLDKVTNTICIVYSINFVTQIVNLGFAIRAFYEIEFIEDLILKD